MGSFYKGVYKELIRMHKEEGLSFKKVVTFNLDEYYPMKKGSYLFSPNRPSRVNDSVAHIISIS